MTISIDKNGIESILAIKVWWGGGVANLYADKDITIPLGACAGRILQANVVSKTGQIGQSGVSKTASVTLDDANNYLKTIYDQTRIEGSYCEVYQYIAQGTPVQQLLMSGVITSDIKWLEGERALSFSIEGGTNRSGQSGEIGYAPVENAFVGLNPEAIGKNWPIVFGTAIKVPATRIIYYDDMMTLEVSNASDATIEIVNGSQLPQSPTVIRLTIDEIIFEGTMTGNIFTPTDKNIAAVTNETLLARDITDPDYDSPAVFWISSSVNLTNKFVWLHDDDDLYTVNFCMVQEGTKCYFSKSWFFTLDETYHVEEAARYCRTDWGEVYHAFTDGGNEYVTSIADSWTLHKGAPVLYDAGTDYMDRYVANLYPTTAILAVWGKRKFNDKTIWAKIPSSYYHYHLDEEQITNPGAVTRNCTFIDFPLPLSHYVCENWETEIYVSLISTLPNNPMDIVRWVTNELTTLTFDEYGSDDPPVTMNFAYFETTDAIEFLKGLVYQAASIIQISGTDLKLTFLAQEPGTGTNIVHNVNDDLIVMKSLELGFKSKEEINTVHKSTYVIDYSGEESSKKSYEINQNLEDLGRQIKEDNMWALTCENPVKAVTDFWGVKTGNSWKTVKMDCFLDLSDAEVFDCIDFDIAPFIPVPVPIRGLVTSVVHDTDRPIVTIEVELAVKAGNDEEDPLYWDLGTAICADPTDSEEDYVPERDPKCPSWSIDVGAKTTRPTREIVIVKWPCKVKRGTAFNLDLELHDRNDNLVAENVIFDYWVYTSDIHDSFRFKRVAMLAGTVTITAMIRLSAIRGRINVKIKIYDKDGSIRDGIIYTWKPRHL